MCVHIYEISCMSTGNNNNPDHILGAIVSEKLVVMMESPQLTTRLLTEPAGYHASSHE